jgi:hypothetical protein
MINLSLFLVFVSRSNEVVRSAACTILDEILEVFAVCFPHQLLYVVKTRVKPSAEFRGLELH